MLKKGIGYKKSKTSNDTIEYRKRHTVRDRVRAILGDRIGDVAGDYKRATIGIE